MVWMDAGKYSGRRPLKHACRDTMVSVGIHANRGGPPGKRKLGPLVGEHAAHRCPLIERQAVHQHHCHFRVRGFLQSPSQHPRDMVGQHWRQGWLVVQGPKALLQPCRENAMSIRSRTLR